jgi:pimeloyl-ACP methyl ester carboxylesterase
MYQTPFVLAPGLMCDHAVWEPLANHLSCFQSRIVIDYHEANSLVQMARRLLEQAPEQFLLAGHSMGGRVALEVLRMAPQRVLGVILMDTGYLPKVAGSVGEEEVRKRLALLQIAQEKGVRAMAQEWVKGMVHPSRLTDQALIGDILDMFDRKNADIFARQLLALIHRPDATPVLKTLTLPTLILCGAQDAWSPPSQHIEMQKCAPHAQLAVIENAGHMATMEMPEAVANAMNQWLLQAKI